ncbi:hypothetical protein AAVH_00864 [Aphelenchoides avenae]|nr:hypothetical protein AAVH_00864 [Aphelenchus avenae]
MAPENIEVEKAVAEIQSGVREVRRHEPSDMNQVMEKINKLQEQLTMHEELMANEPLKLKVILSRL